MHACIPSLPGCSVWCGTCAALAAAAGLLEGTLAPGLLLGAVAAWNLRDAADRGRLNASTFKRLNLGEGGTVRRAQ